MMMMNAEGGNVHVKNIAMMMMNAEGGRNEFSPSIHLAYSTSISLQRSCVFGIHDIVKPRQKCMSYGVAGKVQTCNHNVMSIDPPTIFVTRASKLL